MSDSEILQAWDDYISDYTAKNNDMRQRTQQIISDPNASNADKANAIADQQIQDDYLNQLVTIRANLQTMYDNQQPLPDTVTFNVNGAGMVAKNNQGTIFKITLNTVSSGLDYDILSSDFTIFRLSADSSTPWNGNGYNKFNTAGTVYGVGITATSGGVYYTRSDPKNYVIPGTGGSWLYNNRTLYVCASIVTRSDFNANNIITISTSSNMQALIANDSGVPSEPTAPNNNYVATGIKFDCGSHTVDTESPWDYYNDDVLPEIGDNNNRVYPNGYNPIPDKPGGNMPEFPGETENTGDSIDLNDTTGIGGGFGFMTQYALRAADISELGEKLWSGFDANNPDIDAFINNFKYGFSTDTGSVNFVDIMQFFVSLKFYPFPLGNITTISAAGNNLYIGAGTEPIPITNIIHTMDSYVGILDCGKISVPFWYGDYRDYDIQISVNLPYCGTAELNPADVMGGLLECIYAVDFCTGACCAYVICTTWDGKKFPVATVPGQIGADIPMSGNNANRVAARVVGDRITWVENMLGAAKSIFSGAASIASGNYAGIASMAFAGTDYGIAEEKRKNALMQSGAVSCPVLGSGGGFTAFKQPKTVYLQIRSAQYPDIENFADTMGKPAAEYVQIGDCTGFCQFANVDVSGITTDKSDQMEIKRILESGVYL